MFILVSLVVRLVKNLKTLSVALLWSSQSTSLWLELRHKSGFVPSNRYGHCAAVVEDGLFITHGYYYDHSTGTPQWLSDSWWFAFSREEWFRVVIPDSVPSSRFKASMTVFNGSLFLYGGDNGGHSESKSYVWGSHHNDLWQFQSGAWTPVQTSGGTPPALQGHSAVTLGTSMILFGGLSTSGLSHMDNNVIDDTNDLWTLDLVGFHWHLWPTGDPWPSPRHSHSAVVLNDVMVVFGGSTKGSNPGNLNDLWVFYPSNGTWKEMTTTGSTPSPRGAHAAAADDSKQLMYIYGGAQCQPGCKCSRELWQYSLIKNEWTLVNLPTRGSPIGRHFHSMSITADQVLYLFGGESFEPYKYFNDIWKLDLKLLGKRYRGNESQTAQPHTAPHEPKVSFRTVPSYPGRNRSLNPHLVALKITFGMTAFVILGPLLVICIKRRQEDNPPSKALPQRTSFRTSDHFEPHLKTN